MNKIISKNTLGLQAKVGIRFSCKKFDYLMFFVNYLERAQVCKFERVRLQKYFDNFLMNLLRNNYFKLSSFTSNNIGAISRR